MKYSEGEVVLLSYPAQEVGDLSVLRPQTSIVPTPFVDPYERVARVHPRVPADQRTPTVPLTGVLASCRKSYHSMYLLDRYYQKPLLNV